MEIINAITRTNIAHLLVGGTLYALATKELDGNTFLQVASMAVGFYLARATAQATNGTKPAPTAVTMTVPPTATTPGATATATTGTIPPPPTTP